ncbi:MFS transporter [Aquabacter spiritensis]|uniref:DHA1 family inner membrane transport protein n=1 Tax=Aquabacter spiritensis TaxID=933073 RepID=A0A4R3M5K9_9HYPH|nr:MFS transporter [Aquabacter spiritensis]TCT06747.1 DHA1 family inner membrane transport protein [Aquabacter spiritensis]
MPLSLLSLAVAAFGIGTTEFVIMGLLPEVARDLGVSIPAAGLLVTGYALGVVVGAPVLAVATARLPRKATLAGLMALFIFGNVLCALAPGYGLLMAARVVTAFCHAAFFGIGSVVAADLVPRSRRAQAIALMFAGLTLANVLGVPAGTALGQWLGWRSTFWAVAVIGLAALAALVVLLPARLARPAGGVIAEFRVLGETQVALAMVISVLCSASLFSVFTYIAPLLGEVTGLAPTAVTGALLVFGVGLTAGNMLGGRLADWRLMPSLLAVLVVLVGVLLVLVPASRAPAPALAMLLVWGILAFALVPLLQLRVVDTAARAPGLASTLNQGAFNLGNAIGAWVGALAITWGLSYQHLPLVGAALALAALGLAGLSFRLDRGAMARGGAADADLAR